MPYRGGSLVDLFKPATTGAPINRALRRIADEGGKDMTTFARRYTPKRTGRLADGWEQLPVHRVPNGYRSGTTNRVWYAHLVEHGVEEHDIEPKTSGALNTPEGPRAGVHHPGTEGAHMLARAAEEVEAGFSLRAQPALSTWATEIEDAAKQHKGIE